MTKEKVHLATFVGPTDQLEIDGHVLVRDVQYAVTSALYKRLHVRTDCACLWNIEPGSEEDVRPDPPEVPVEQATGAENAPQAAANPNTGESLDEPDVSAKDNLTSNKE